MARRLLQEVQTQKGKSVKQIREGVERGEFKTIDLNEAAELASGK